MNDWGRRVLFGSLAGALLGVLLGLGLGRLLWPPDQAPPTPSPSATALPPEATEAPATPLPTAGAQTDGEAIVLISALYALDGDLLRAQERLAALDVADAPAAVAELALHHASLGNRQLATDLATLATALGQEQAELLTYVATPAPTPEPPTPTPTASPSPTAMPTATPSPSPTNTPAPTATPLPTRRPATRQPPPATPRPATATPLPLVWDPRVDLLNPPIRLVEGGAAPGQHYWRLVRLEWWKASEGGNTLIYITTLDEDGQPAWGQPVIIEHGEKETLYTTPKAGEPYGANYPMFSTLNSYQVYVGGDLPSERVTGLGLGEWRGSTDHTTFVLVFQKSTQ